MGKPLKSCLSFKQALGGRLLLLALLWTVGAPIRVQGVVINWDSLVWTPGTLINSYDLDPTHPGIDVTVSISGTTGAFQANYPQLTKTLTGGLNPPENSLQLGLNFTADTQTITVTVIFWYTDGVDQAAFSLFDVDRSGTSYIDQVSSIQARYNFNPYVGATISGSANNSVAGSGTGQTISGTGLAADNSSSGNATINFGTNVINQVTFTFGNNAASQADPANQSISLYDISYRPKVIPEMNPGMGALVICGLVVGIRTLRAKKLA